MSLTRMRDAIVDALVGGNEEDRHEAEANEFGRAFRRLRMERDHWRREAERLAQIVGADTRFIAKQAEQIKERDAQLADERERRANATAMLQTFQFFRDGVKANLAEPVRPQGDNILVLTDRERAA